MLRPVSDADLAPLADIVAMPTVRDWWSGADDRERVFSDLKEHTASFVIQVQGAIAGWLGCEEERDYYYPSAALDIVLAPDFQDRGLGPEALRLVVDWLVEERGHHRITIDPNIANERAIRCYQRVGFRRVGVMEAYERGDDGKWHDALFMELVRFPADGAGRPDARSRRLAGAQSPAWR